jgi:hypothetical protein
MLRVVVAFAVGVLAEACLPPGPASTPGSPTAAAAPVLPYARSAFSGCTYFPLGVESGEPPPVPIPQQALEAGARILDGCPEYVTLPANFGTVLPQDPKARVFLFLRTAAPDRCWYSDSGAPSPDTARCQMAPGDTRSSPPR